MNSLVNAAYIVFLMSVFCLLGATVTLISTVNIPKQFQIFVFSVIGAFVLGYIVLHVVFFLGQRRWLNRLQGMFSRHSDTPHFPTVKVDHGDHEFLYAASLGIDGDLADRTVPVASCTEIEDELGFAVNERSAWVEIDGLPLGAAKAVNVIQKEWKLRAAEEAEIVGDDRGLIDL